MTSEITHEEAKALADKIRHLLTHFPRLTHSMLQVGLGSSVPAAVWRPILEEMLVEEEVCISTVMTTLPTGRTANYAIIQLTTNE